MLPYDKKAIFRGMTGKEGIGQITNMFYRSIVVCHKHFQWDLKTRTEFFQLAGREELTGKLEGLTDNQARMLFRYLSAECLMDCFSPLYEACFDARKDVKLMEYVGHVLRSLSDPKHPMDWEFLGTMEWEGKPVELRALRAVWEHAQGRLSAEVDSLPVQALFFAGKGDTPKRRKTLQEVLEMFGSEPAQRIWAGLNNEEMEQGGE